MSKLSDRMVSLNMVQLRTEALLHLQKFELNAAHAYISFYNESAKVPYHSTDHCLTVVVWCARLANLCHTWTLTSQRGLLLGALFHDFNHSGGQTTDNKNIERALQGLNEFLAIHQRHFSDVDMEVARKVIECTVFPFTVEPETYEQRIIRDADILQSIDINYESILGERLRSEISVSRGKTVTRKQFAVGEMAFLETIKMHTPPGEIIWAANFPYLMQRFSEIAGN